MSETLDPIRWNACVEGIRESLRADIYLIAGGLESPAGTDVFDCVRENVDRGKRPNVLVILATFGGDADVAYRIARCYQTQYSNGKFILCVPEFCESAGTLVAIGADQLVMADNAELGPLDVQIRKPDEVGERISGLTPSQALDFLQEETFKLFEYHFLQLRGRSGRGIRTCTAAEIATNLTTGLFAPVYAQLDPLLLGEYHRNMKIATEYGKRLNRNLKQRDSLETLTHGYPSHEFVIDRNEAATLFRDVRSPTPEESQLVAWLTPQIFEGLGHEDEQGRSVATIAYIDTIPIPPEQNMRANDEQQEPLEREVVPEGTEDPSSGQADAESYIAGPSESVSPAAKQE